MTYYHCSPVSDLAILHPGKPKNFDKPQRVCMTSMLPMALMYSVRNYEYTYGYTREGQIHFDEYFPNELEILYRGRRAHLDTCAPEAVETTQIPNEAVSSGDAPVLSSIMIPDASEALLEQERLGNLVIRRHHERSEKLLEWIRHTEADVICKHDLPHNPGPMADYYREHYPRSWQDVLESE